MFTFALSVSLNVGVVLDFRAFGGVERQVEALAQHLAAAPEMNVSILLIGNISAFEERVARQGPLYRIAQIEEGQTLHAIERREPVDVFIINQPHVMQQNFFMKRRTVVAKVIAVYHGQSFSDYWDLAPLRECFKAVDATVVLSRADRIFNHRQGVENVFYIPNYFPPNFRQENRIKMEHKENNILLLGRFSLEKRQDLAIRVFERVKQQVPDATLTLAGGFFSPFMVQLVQQQLADASDEIRNSVAVINDTADVGALYREAKVLLMTSPNEGFPLVLNEASTYQIPVAMFRLGQLENAAGALTAKQFDVNELADRVVVLLKNPEIAEEVVQRGRESNKKFTDDSITEKWLQLIGFVKCDEKPCHAPAREKMDMMRYYSAMWEAEQRFVDGWNPAIIPK